MPRENPEKRRSWTKKIKNWKTSGLSARKWCLEKGENYHTFKYWRQALKKEKPQPFFKELKENEPTLDIELSYRDLKILFPNGCTIALLKQCLKSMKEIQCSP